jgi:hypothetical protein
MLSFHTARQTAYIKTLIDSGATENFISPEVITRLGIKTRSLPVPVDLKTVDGSTHKEGKITEYCWLKVTHGDKQYKDVFFVASLGKDRLILGYPFLYHFNPDIDWQKRRLGGGSPHIYSTWEEPRGAQVVRLQAKAIREVGMPGPDEAIYVKRTNFAQQWAHRYDQGEKLTLATIPEKYRRHAHVFSEEASKRFPPQRSEDMTIKFRPDAPHTINCKVYPVSQKDKQTLLDFLDGEEALERVYKGASNIVSPTFLIDKKEKGEKRVVMDYRKVNSYTVNDNNPLPNIQVALEQLHGKTLFSKFDIRWGYNNIRIAEEDQHKAAFKTPFGTYIPCVMYFGLRNAPPFFQRTMHRDFADLLQQYPQELGNYMDDWWIATTSDKEGRKRHEQIVHAFLDRMEECSYFLKPSKCVFEQDSINILGWIVGQGQVRIDPAKMKGLSEWPRELKTVHDIRQILGLLGYQRPFIRGFAEIARPLTNLTKKDVKFEWTQECKDALDKLIAAVTCGPTLWHPDPTRQYELYTDASSFAVGAVLLQRDDQNKPRVVGYHSNSLNSAERNYTVGDREFLGIIKALQWCRHLVVDSPHKILLYTDHDNLRYYRHPQKICRRVARYLGVLADFDLEIRHIAGTKNWADPLSRRPDLKPEEGDNEDVVALPDAIFAKVLAITQAEDDIAKGQSEEEKQIQQWNTKYGLTQDEEGIWRKGTAVVVAQPQTWKKSIVEHYHDAHTAGHPGVWKTLFAIVHDFWWPGIRQDVKDYIAGCATCQATKTVTHRNKPELSPITPEHPVPFGTIAVDFITKLPKSRDFDTILTITDHDCTKAVILVPCCEGEPVENIAEAYYQKAFPYIGIPHKVISDRDTRFTSKLFKEVCDQLKIRQNISTAYHPQTDGQSERTNQTVETILRIYCNHRQTNWSEHLPLVQYIINARPSSATKVAPFDAWMGHIPRTHQTYHPSPLPKFEERKVELLKTRLQIDKAIRHAQELMIKERAFKPYQEGERVWLEGTHLNTTHPTFKLRAKRFGPFPIKKKLSAVAYELDLPSQWRIHPVFNATQLHPYKETEIHGPNFPEPPPEMVAEEEEYEVEEIRDARSYGRARQLQYLIKWKGYSEAHNSWEPVKHIHAPQKLQEFKDKHPTAIKEATLGEMDRTALLRSTTVTQPTLNRQVAMTSTPPQGSLTPEAFDRLLSSPPQPLSAEQEAHVAGVLQLMEEADRQFYSAQGSPVEPSSSGLLGPDFGPLPQSPAPFASPAYVPRTPSPIPEVQQILAAQEEEEIEAALAGRPRSHSTSSTPNSEVSALGERDAHFHQSYQQQADDYMTVNPRPPSSSLSSESSHHSSGLSYHDASPFPAAPEEIFPQLEEGSTLWGDYSDHPGKGWVSNQTGVTKTALRVPHPHGGQAVPANYNRYTFNGYGEPIVEGTMGAHEPVWGEPLTAQAEETRRGLSNAPPLDLLEAENYFHGGVQRALAHLSDFGVQADVYRLHSAPIQRAALAREEQVVKSLEQVAQAARRELEARKSGFLRHQDAARDRLRKAQVMDRLSPYLMYDEGRGEDMWAPARVRAHAEGYARKTSTRRARNVCRYCSAEGHFNWECDNPHEQCLRMGGSVCRVPPSHANLEVGRTSTCPFQGRKDKGKGKAKKPSPQGSPSRKQSWGQDWA